MEITPANTPVTPPEIIPDLVVKAERKRKLPLIVISLLGIVTLTLLFFSAVLNSNKPGSQLTLEPTPTPTPPSNESYDTSTWIIYTVAPLELTLKLPPMLATVENLILTEAQSQTGKQLCWTSWILEAYKANTFGECSNMPFTLHTTTANFQSRQVNAFYHNRGFGINNNQIFVLRSDFAPIELEPSVASLYTNPNNVDMLIIEGQSTDTGNPISGTPGENALGAVINLQQTSYPALTITLKLDSLRTPALFKAIIDTVQVRSALIPTGIQQSPLSGTPEPTHTTKTCIIAGCSSQLCVSSVEKDIVTTCEFKWEYQCYRSAKCETQSNGECGWTMTDSLQACLNQYR